ncbi:hypothetical protein BLNAU_262 [Blattamonas nauphoetae]|uniref:Uncharacterized protein n=1 Tax=Blattamonas nauphoetae TaxID=2049346 RepID=A0ABQ9YMI7_9EUKA|nr:hypothetical protein BLNAU_262 [Blattamonas nauphoetae]
MRDAKEAEERRRKKEEWRLEVQLKEENLRKEETRQRTEEQEKTALDTVLLHSSHDRTDTAGLSEDEDDSQTTHIIVEHIIIRLILSPLHPNTIHPHPKVQFSTSLYSRTSSRTSGTSPTLTLTETKRDLFERECQTRHTQRHEKEKQGRRREDAERRRKPRLIKAEVQRREGDQWRGKNDS